MTSINVHEAKTHLSSILADIERNGKKVVICRHGRAVAELIPVSKGHRTKLDPKLKNIKIKDDPVISTEKEWEDV